MQRPTLAYRAARSLRAAAIAGRMPQPIAGALVIPWPVHIGPYSLAVVWATRNDFSSKNRLSESCCNLQVIKLDKSLTGRRLAEHFWTRVVSLMHYASGLDHDRSGEGAYAHGYAAALVEFIRDNPDTWAWFNALVCGDGKTFFPVEAFYASTLKRFQGMSAVAAPREVRIGRRAWKVKCFSKSTANRLRRWAQCDVYNRVLEYCEILEGPHLAVIFWHELMHAMHQEAGIGDGGSHNRYIRTQARGTLAFMRQNPSAWYWFLRLTGKAVNHGSRSLHRLTRENRRAAIRAGGILALTAPPAVRAVL
jgi:hypothetical protein